MMIFKKKLDLQIVSTSFDLVRALFKIINVKHLEHYMHWILDWRHLVMILCLS